LRSLLRAWGDAFTGIKRADTASVENYSMFGNSLHDGKEIFVRTARIARLAVVTIARLHKFPRNQGGPRQILAGRSA
jgi:hypothetical protein